MILAVLLPPGSYFVLCKAPCFFYKYLQQAMRYNKFLQGPSVWSLIKISLIA